MVTNIWVAFSERLLTKITFKNFILFRLVSRGSIFLSLQLTFLHPSDSQRPHSGTESDHTNSNFRRVTVSPGPNSDYYYEDDQSIDEVDAALSNLDDEIDDTEQALSTWSSSAPQTTSYGSYLGSPSHLSLPSLFSPRSPSPSSVGIGGPRLRLSRITERTEEASSRPVSGTSSQNRRSGFMGTGHGRSATEPSGNREMPPPGRASQLIAAFETASPSAGHTRSATSPRPSSPFYSSTGSYSRPSSPTKSSWTGTAPTHSTYPSRTYTDSRPTGTSTYTPTAYSAVTTSQTATSITPTDPVTTPTNTPRRPQTSPRSPLASVRNVVNLWKDRTPTRNGKSPVTRNTSESPPPQPEESGEGGLFGIRRSASARLRGQRRDSDQSLGIDVAELSRFVGGSGTETVGFHFILLSHRDLSCSSLFISELCTISMCIQTLLIYGRDARLYCTDTHFFWLG